MNMLAATLLLTYTEEGEILTSTSSHVSAGRFRPHPSDLKSRTNTRADGRTGILDIISYNRTSPPSDLFLTYPLGIPSMPDGPGRSGQGDYTESIGQVGGVGCGSG